MDELNRVRSAISNSHRNGSYVYSCLAKLSDSSTNKTDEGKIEPNSDVRPCPSNQQTRPSERRNFSTYDSTVSRNPLTETENGWLTSKQEKKKAWTAIYGLWIRPQEGEGIYSSITTTTKTVMKTRRRLWWDMKLRSSRYPWVVTFEGTRPEPSVVGHATTTAPYMLRCGSQ